MEPPLVVVADELTVRFVSVVRTIDDCEGREAGIDGEGDTVTPGAWGFRLTAKGCKVWLEATESASVLEKPARLSISRARLLQGVPTQRCHVA